MGGQKYKEMAWGKSCDKILVVGNPMAENPNSSVTENAGFLNSSVLPLKIAQNFSVLPFSSINCMGKYSFFRSLLKFFFEKYP